MLYYIRFSGCPSDEYPDAQKVLRHSVLQAFFLKLFYEFIYTHLLQPTITLERIQLDQPRKAISTGLRRKSTFISRAWIDFE